MVASRCPFHDVLAGELQTRSPFTIYASGAFAWKRMESTDQTRGSGEEPRSTENEQQGEERFGSPKSLRGR
ncbi:MAG: hypothetical protein ACI9PP_002252 [Halobacteriales archaeon]|jgi:hypothetical protein